MAISTTFDAITLVENGIVLCLKNDKKTTISFSDLDKIYMKVYKLKPAHEFAFIVFPFLLLFLGIQYLMIEKVMLVALFVIIPVSVKMYKYKSYGLMIDLKDGTVYRKKVSLVTKSENVSIVNAVKKEQLNYYYKTKGLQELEEPQFYQVKAS